jgi:hypothetical protein
VTTLYCREHSYDMLAHGAWACPFCNTPAGRVAGHERVTDTPRVQAVALKVSRAMLEYSNPAMKDTLRVAEYATNEYRTLGLGLECELVEARATIAELRGQLEAAEQHVTILRGQVEAAGADARRTAFERDTEKHIVSMYHHLAGGARCCTQCRTCRDHAENALKTEKNHRAHRAAIAKGKGE